MNKTEGPHGPMGVVGHSHPRRPYYVVPQYTPGPAVVVHETVPSNPVPSNPLPAAEASPVFLVNPAEVGQTIRFLVDGQQHRLEPGRTLQPAASTPAIIQFDRGGQLGIARYSLSEGVYKFRLTEEGWSLTRQVFAVTLDNSADATDFHYLVDGELAVAAAGQSQTHQSYLPIVISFDRGDGETAQLALPSGTYQIAVNPETDLWDLFAADEGPATSGA